MPLKILYYYCYRDAYHVHTWQYCAGLCDGNWNCKSWVWKQSQSKCTFYGQANCELLHNASTVSGTRKCQQTNGHDPPPTYEN